MSLKDLLEYRRSVRVYDNQKPIDTDQVRDCLEQATLAPNSSNLQLWEFIHITDKSYTDAITDACLGQTAASTADQWVVFVTRQDLH
mgnify:FL=1